MDASTAPYIVFSKVNALKIAWQPINNINRVQNILKPWFTKNQFYNTWVYEIKVKSSKNVNIKTSGSFSQVYETTFTQQQFEQYNRFSGDWVNDNHFYTISKYLKLL